MDLRQLRLKTGRTQEAMAQALRISLGTLRNWERGRVMLCPPIVHIPLYLVVYQCDLDTLIKAVYASNNALTTEET